MTAPVLEHYYEPRGVQEELFHRNDDEVLVSGPAGTGKSRACLEKMFLWCWQYPGMYCLIVRKTRSDLASTAIRTWERFVAAEDIRAGNVVYRGPSTQRPASYTFSNGSVVVIGGLVPDITKVMSAEYDMIYIQEATELDEEQFEKLTTRLRVGVAPYLQVLADCNPDHPQHWLKVRCDQGKTVMLNSRHEENPVFFDGAGRVTSEGVAYINRLDNLSGVTYLRLRKGQWAAAEGIIFADWLPSVHEVPRFEPPDEWEHHWSVDFGFQNPFTWQNWVEDPEGRLFLYQEIYFSQRLVERHAVDIKAAVNGQYSPRWILCDHDAEDRATLHKHLGLPNKAAWKDVSTGIEAVQSRIKKNRLFVMKGSLVERDQSLVDAKKPTCLAEEIPGYIWHVRKTSPGITAVKEGPVKENDHGCDAMRYEVAALDLRGRPSVRWA